MLEYAILVLLFPLLAFVLVGVLGRRIPGGGAHVVVAAFIASFVVSLVLFVQAAQPGGPIATGVPEEIPLFTWVPGENGGAGIGFGLRLDTLSLLMMVVVSFLSTLIATYSIGYMKHEEGKPRFFAEIALFVTGMLGTVSADNFLQLLIFWEIMGLCSYLLIGFWHHKPEAASAAKKAFMVTRIGDVLFLIGILVIYVVFGTFRFSELTAKIATMGVDPGIMTIIPILLFGGAVGKSAQFPLHFWLPDAMEGPTPVSALIHAATMVKAGVYLVARSFIFLVPLREVGGQTEVIQDLVPTNAILLVAVIGGFTAFFAATMALANTDIKRVLAFSTISQLAYMFLGLGAGAWLMYSSGEPETAGYTAGIFHLMNHAFFKALLFLAAGSVIHAVHTNDMREMGGLRKALPWTYRTMLIGSLALAGIPPLSGFWSKDEILAVTFENGASHPVFYALYALGLLTAFMTAFYTFRMIFMTFHGESRAHAHAGAAPPHESPWVMVGPLVILMGFAAISGLFAFFTNGFGNLVYYGEPHAASPLLPFTTFPDVALVGLSIAAAVGGIALAYLVYEKKRIPASVFTATESRQALHTALQNRYYIDGAANKVGQVVYLGFARILEVFDRRVVDGAVNGIARAGAGIATASARFDRTVIDGAVNAISLDTVRSSRTLRRVQTGRVSNYTLMIALGIALIIVAIFLGKFLGGI